VNLQARFLIALAQAFAAMGLYKAGHPARERAIDALFSLARELQAAEPEVEYTFLSGEVIWGDEPLWDLRRWEWAGRFSDAGIQRLAFVREVSRADLDHFLIDAFALLSGHPESPVTASDIGGGYPSAIVYGAVRLRSDDSVEEVEEGGEPELEPVATLTLGFILREELEAIEWILDEVKNGRSLRLLEVESVVRSLLVAMHADHHLLIPLLHLERLERYPATHALNVATLAMALGEWMGMGLDEVRSLGVAALLHDVGMVRVSDETLNRTGALSERERTLLNSHTVEGARIILESDRRLDVAAAVAYEHHLRTDGGGYPRLVHPRARHPCSKVVQICDVYDALRSGRPYREGWDHESALDHIRKGAGTEFDSEIGEAFAAMMERGEHHMAILRNEDEPLPRSADPIAGDQGGEAEGAAGEEEGGEETPDGGAIPPLRF